MPQYDNFDPQTPVTAVFWEGLSVGETVTRLLRAGFCESDIYALGVLAGSAPDLSSFFAGCGVPARDATYFNQCFEDGAIVLIVRTLTVRDQRRALQVVQRSGGLLPPSWALPGSAGHEAEPPKESSGSRHP